MTHTVSFSLPWPPSVNHYWRLGLLPMKRGSRKMRPCVLLSERATQYRLFAINALRLQRVPVGKLTGLLQITMRCCPPDLRDRDLDNLLKALLDSIAHAGVIRNDADFDRIVMERGPVMPEGRIHISILEIPGGATVSGELFAEAV